MNLFRQPVKVYGFLGRDAEEPTSGTTSDDSCVVLALLIESVTSDKSTGLQIARTLQVPIVCFRQDFRDATRDMREGDHIEVEGELRLCEQDGPVVWIRESRVMRIAGPKVCASHVRRLDGPVNSADG